MNFDLSEEQLALREIARDFLAERWPADRMRAALDKMPATIDEPVWKEIVTMGWLGAAAPESVGGIAGDVMTAAVLAEEAGRAVLPGPFASSQLAAVAIERAGDGPVRSELLAEVLEGRTRATVAFDEPGAAWGPDGITAGARCIYGAWALSGTKILVPDADAADWLLVAAQTPSGPGLVRVASGATGISIEPMRRLDAQAISVVTFEDVPCTPDDLLGGAGAGALLRTVANVGAALCAADLLGVAEAALAMTTAYAAERVQFGRPIGSFQAVSHRLADVQVDVEIGRSLLYGACLALDESRDEAPALVSAAKAWLSDAAVRAGESALQLHGGVGFTWEYDVHLLLRRARSNAASFGCADDHRDRVADHMERTGMKSVRAPRS